MKNDPYCLAPPASVVAEVYRPQYWTGGVHMPTVCLRGLPLPDIAKGVKVFPSKRLNDPCYGTAGCELLGSAPAVALPYVARGCAHNELNAVRVRMTFPHVCKRQWSDQRQARAWLHATYLHAGPVDVDEEAWLKHNTPKWQSRVEPHLREPGLATRIEEGNRLNVKREILPSIARGSPKNLKARIVQAKHDEFLTKVGPWVWSRGLMLKRDLNHRCPYFYASGAHPEDVGSWLEREWHRIRRLHGFAFVADIDGTNFDGHQRQDALKHNAWQRGHYQPPNEVERLMRTTWTMTGTGMRGTVVRNACSRHTGASDTSDGNSENSLDLIIGFVGHVLGWDRIHDHLSVCVLGDDTLFVMSPELTRLASEGIVGYYADRGITAEFNYHDHPAKTEFCSSRFLPTEDGWVLVPKTGRLLSKAMWRLRGQSPLNDKDWLTAVTTGLDYNVGWHPLLSGWVQRLKERHGTSERLRAINDRSNPSHQYQFESHKRHQPTQETWEWLQVLYDGVDLEHVARCITAHDGVGLWHDPQVAAVVMKDCGLTAAASKCWDSLFDEWRSDQPDLRWLHELPPWFGDMDDPLGAGAP